MSGLDIAALPATRPEEAGLCGKRLARLGAALRAEVEAGRTPGGVVAIARHGRLVHHEAVGWLDREAGIPMPPDAVFSIASMTKPVTGVAALTLLEEGRLTLGDPVAAHVPEMARMRVALRTAGDGPLETTPARRTMTVQDAMRHTSGLTYGSRGDTAAHRVYGASSGWVAATKTAEEFAGYLAGLPLLYEPGTAWEYGLSTDLLGLIVERVAGRGLGQVMQERIFGPLGMAETAHVLPEGRAARFARALPRDPLTGNAQAVEPPLAPPRMETGGTGLVSTATDYLRLAQMLLDRGSFGGARVLGPKTVDLMAADHLGSGIENRLETMDPALAGYGFGLTVAVRRDAGRSAYLGSPGAFGWTGVYGTMFWVDPAERLAVVYMAHTPGDIRLRFRRLVNALVYQAITD